MTSPEKPAKGGFFVTPPPIPQPSRLRRFIDNVVGLLLFFALVALVALIVEVLKP